MPEPAKTLITVATYNELENLPALVEAIHQQAPEADILVIDDGSPDGTGQWCDEKHAEDPRVRCLHRQGKLGLGTAIIAGMNYAIEHGYDRVLNMDADFSHHPRYIPAMLALVEGKDAVDVSIGSRYVTGGGTVGWPWHRKFMSSSVNLYARTLLRLRPRDCSGAYRCYTTAALKKIDLERVISRGYSFQEEILWHLRRAGCTMAETPIMFADRERGQSKINQREALAAVW
ncbi:MAG: polyprenol monophosphomannose synthase, partial [Planctomycetales bacterium]|nr:polyprenol monophosphomannose synthase [Planctomycetales bacterium]